MRITVITSDSGLKALCERVRQERSFEHLSLRFLVPGGCPDGNEGCIWEFHPAFFPARLTQDQVFHTLFVVDPEHLPQFRLRLGHIRASVVIKPVREQALLPFFEHSLRETEGDGREFDKPIAPKTQKISTDEQIRRQPDDGNGNFLARAVHDFQVPLITLGGYCRLLKEQSVGPVNPSQIEILGRMQNSIDRVSRAVNAMAELSAGHFLSEPRLEKGDIGDCIRDAVGEVTPLATERHLRLSVALEDPIGDLLFDSKRIVQVLVNLLENACKFATKHSTVEISGQSRHSKRRRASDLAESTLAVRAVWTESYRIEIKDSGTPIVTDNPDMIFEQRASYASGRDRSGGGLGLATCKMIVAAHAGKIWAESGQDGTRFAFILPYHDKVSKRSTTAAQHRSSG